MHKATMANLCDAHLILFHVVHAVWFGLYSPSGFILALKSWNLDFYILPCGLHFIITSELLPEFPGHTQELPSENLISQIARKPRLKWRL